MLISDSLMRWTRSTELGSIKSSYHGPIKWVDIADYCKKSLYFWSAKFCSYVEVAGSPKTCEIYKEILYREK